MYWTDRHRVPVLGQLSQPVRLHGRGQIFITGFEFCCAEPGSDDFTVAAMAGAWCGGASHRLLRIGQLAQQHFTPNPPNDFIPESR